MKSFIHSRVGRLVLTVLGLGLLVFLLARIGVRAAIQEASHIGWMFAVVFLLGGVPHILRTLSWKRLLQLEEGGPGFWRLFAWWMGGEAISHLSFSWSGEAYRVVVPRQHITVARGAVAQAMNRVIYSLCSLLVAAVGLGMGLAVLNLPAGLHATILRVLMVVGGVLLAGYLAVRLSVRRWRQRSANGATPPASAGGSRIRRTLRELRINLEEISSQRPRDFAFLLMINLVVALVGVAEVWLILYALGSPVGFHEALFIEGFLKLLSGLAYFVPGNIGVAEGGIVLILSLLRVTAAAGLALALVRRARALAWVAVGCVVLLALGTGFRGPSEEEMASAALEHALENTARR